MKILVVIPTYNEVDNVKKIVPATLEAFIQMPHHECHILVVDSNSPDGTGEVVRELSRNYHNVHLLMEREKTGLGGAYIYAFKYAMQNLYPDVVIEMDADFQHNPNDLPRLVAKIEQGYDYVIGSRFAKGGSIPKEWGLSRKFWSVGGNIFSKVVLGIYSVSDFTSGFKASRVKNYLDRLDLDSVKSKGFAYKIDLLYKMYKLNAKIAEVPIEFGLRDRGDSKMQGNNALDSLKVVLAIRINDNKEFFKFVCVGITGLVTDMAVSNILRVVTSVPVIATVTSNVLAMTITFILNNAWTFRERRRGTKIAFTFVIYVLSSSIPVVFRALIVKLFVDALGNQLIPFNAGQLIGIAFGLVWNYVVYSKLIWRKKAYKE